MSDPTPSDPRPYGFEVVRLARLEARLVTYDWAWARDNAERIDQNWLRRRAEQPALFEGTVLMACGCAITGDTCRLDLFETPYSRFLAYRDGGSPDGHVANAFAAIVPWSADGAVLLGRMGVHTSNAGQIYFPCGTPDLDDVRGPAVDFSGSAVRELLEETGLRVPEDDEPEDWICLRGEGQLAFLRPVRFEEDAAVLIERMELHALREDEPELAGIVAVRGSADFAAAMPGFVRAYLARAFEADDGGADVTP